MLRIIANKSAQGATRYFDDGLSKSDYYAEKGEIIGQWGGHTAKLLELTGEVTRNEFEALAYNRNPITGEQLTARNASSRRVGYDFTFSVPKSVSIIYSQTKDKDIYNAFNEAINETMLEIEACASTRVRSKGKNENRITGNLIWGTFTHEDARPVAGIPDPHLHQHVFVFNATYDQVEKKFKAAQFGDIKANAPYFEAAFHSRLATNLRKAGYQIERNAKDFEIEGFERSTIDKFSNRTREINQKAEEMGLTYPEDIGKLGALTRENKRTGYDKEGIRMQWRSRLNEKELELIALSKNSDNTDKNENQISPGKALDFAFDHCLERKSVVSEKELLTVALKRSIGANTPESLKKELTSRNDLLSRKDTTSGELIFTTQEAMTEEASLRNTSRKGKGILLPINPDYQVKNEKLTQEQTTAVKHVLSSEDFITIIAGGAGTGKTWSIKEVAEGIKEKGINFGAFAPSSAASRQVQRDDGFKNATTIAELLQSKKRQESVKDGVIWLDEAGMVGNKTMNQVIKVAQEQNARILLTGDIKQHSSVERGDALRTIEKFGGITPARISKIQRQKNEDYRSAVRAISNGDIEKGYSILDRMGALQEATDFEQAKENIANEYTTSLKQKENVLVVSTTHAQGKAVTEKIRETLKNEGILQGKEKVIQTQKNLSYTTAEKSDPASYSNGMLIQFHQNVKGGIKRGNKYQVIGTDENGNIIIENQRKKERRQLPLDDADKFSVYQPEIIGLSIGDKIRITQNGFSNERKRLNNGNILSVKGFDHKGNIIASTGKNSVVLSKDFGNLTHGYYTTSPASQGKSVNKVIIMQSSLTGKAASKEQFYVSASRGKFAISIHTDDKDSLLRSVKRSSQRMTATEVASSQQMEKSLKNKLKKIGAIYRSGLSKVANLKDKWQNRTASVISMISNPPKAVRNAPIRTK